MAKAKDLNELEKGLDEEETHFNAIDEKSKKLLKEFEKVKQELDEADRLAREAEGDNKE